MEAIDIRAMRAAATQKLLGYVDMKHDYERAVLGVVFDGRTDNQGIRAGKSDPTAFKGIRLAEQTGDMLAWINACEALMSTCGQKKRWLIGLRQEHVPESGGGRPGWLEYCQEEMLERYGVRASQRTLKEWWYDVVTTMVMIGLRKGIL